MALAFDPELEAAFLPVWGRVLELLAGKRGVAPLAVPWSSENPKASWENA